MTLDCRGAGLGLRWPHLRQVLSERPAVPWFEVHSCNFISGELNRALLRQLREHYPISLHGVSLNLGGVEPLDRDYLRRLRTLVDELQPGLVSEHAAFTAFGGQFFHELLPVPFSEASVNNMAARIRQLQDALGRQILLENATRYYQHAAAQMNEGQFLAAVAEQADCLLLLDLNNARVNEHNLGESAREFVAALPVERVAEIHLAGYSERGERWVDSHSSEICPQLWQLYAECAEQFNDVPCLIEWDSELPDFSRLQQQRLQAEAIVTAVELNRVTA